MPSALLCHPKLKQDCGTALVLPSITLKACLLSVPVAVAAWTKSYSANGPHRPLNLLDQQVRRRVDKGAC